MSDINTVKTQIQSLIDLANTTTGNQDTNLTDGVNALVSGYGQGGSSGGSSSGSYADQLYDFFGVDKDVYPYVMLQIIYRSTNTSYPYMYKINFFDDVRASINQPRLICFRDISQSTHDYYIKDFSNIEQVVTAFKENIIKENLTSAYSGDILDEARVTHYTNFDYTLVNSTLYRLDEVEEKLPYDGLENGYDVMFYDEHNRGLAFYSIKQGHAINPPIYNTNNWQTSDGVVASFPYTPSGDTIFYALNSTYADQLYEFYGVDKGVYPYLTLFLYDGYGEINFTTPKATLTTVEFILGTPRLFASTQSVDSSVINLLSDIKSLVSKITELMPKVNSFAYGGGFPTSSSRYILTNYSTDGYLTDMGGKYRLDE